MFALIGSFATNLLHHVDQQLNTIYLYAFCTIFNDDCIPVCQVSTEENSFSLFSRFFNDCRRSLLPIPSIVTLDYYWNHIKSMNSVFNINLSYEKYLLTCFRYLIDKKI